jgi:hypothetical protein
MDWYAEESFCHELAGVCSPCLNQNALPAHKHP